MSWAARSCVTLSFGSEPCPLPRSRSSSAGRLFPEVSPNGPVPGVLQSATILAIRGPAAGKSTSAPRVIIVESATPRPEVCRRPSAIVSSTHAPDGPGVTPRAASGSRSYSRILSKSWRRLIPSFSAVRVRLPWQASQGPADRPALDLGQERPEGEFLDRVARRGRVDSGRPARRPRRARGGWRGPCAAMAARARAFSSWRTFPGQGLESDHRQRLGREREPGPAVLALQAAEDVLGQRGDVLGPVAERRDRDPDDVEPVEKILAEPAGGDLA